MCHCSRIYAVVLTLCFLLLPGMAGSREYNGAYEGETLNRVAFPLGGMGAGMICLEGNACISHVSVRHQPEVYNEPYMFGAIAVKGLANGAKVLEGPVQNHKIFGGPHSGNGNANKTYGFPRFEQAEFQARFPFGKVNLKDGDIPMDIEIQGWSPFIPGDEDKSSLPVAGLEYTFSNSTRMADKRRATAHGNGDYFASSRALSID